MSPRARLFGLGLAVSLAILAASPSGSAGQTPISGTLDKPGYTVIGVAANGQARTVVAPEGRFTLVPPAETVTLHLRSPAGTYAGPVVLEETGNAVTRARAEVRRAKRSVKKAKRKVKAARRKLGQATAEPAKRKASKQLKEARRRLRKARRRLKRARRQLREARNQAALRPYRAILGVKGGAPLGAVKVDPAAGYALVRGLADKWADAGRVAQANGDVPIGAGNFGHVPSGRTDGAAIGDLDLDAVPDSLDVDDDGDLILDALDDSPAALASQVGPRPGNPCAPNPFCANSNLFVPATATANSHVGSDDATINARLQQFGNLSLSILLGGPVELDCGGAQQQPPRPGGLIYCRPHTSGGTGMVSGAAFPDCCDGEDGDGLGTMFNNAIPAFPPVMAINHSAPSEEIGTGNVLLQHIATSGDVSDCPPPGGKASPACTSFASTLSFVFHAPPALFAYTPEGGSSTPVQYPITGPLTVRDGDGDGDVEVALTFFRPQRRPTPAEPGYGQTGAWTDIGGLVYGVPVDFVAGSPGTGGSCAQDAFTESDDELGPRPPAPSTPGGLVDSAPDRPASSADTFTFTLDITKCIGGAAWNPGQDVGLSFRASKAGSLTDQSGVIFKRGS